MEFQDYKKYKWFFTSSGKLVVGGKSAEQNDELLKKMKNFERDFVVMHTESPGSPFSIIFSEIKDISKADKEECAVFTASFSKAWKQKKKKAVVNSFRFSQIYKTGGMKTGTWGLSGKVERIEAPLKLILTEQKSVLRAVPEKAITNKKNAFFVILPGKIEKGAILPKIELELKD